MHDFFRTTSSRDRILTNSSHPTYMLSLLNFAKTLKFYKWHIKGLQLSLEIKAFKTSKVENLKEELNRVWQLLQHRLRLAEVAITREEKFECRLWQDIRSQNLHQQNTSSEETWGDVFVDVRERRRQPKVIKLFSKAPTPVMKRSRETFIGCLATDRLKISKLAVKKTNLESSSPSSYY